MQSHESQTMEPRTALKYELFGAWCGPIFSVMAVGSWFVLAHWYNPAAASLEPAQLKAWYADRQFQVILGMSIFCLSTAFFTVYSIQVGLWLWRFEGRSPLMALTQTFGGFAVVIYVFISNCLWIGVAYRANTAVNSDILVALNDAAWFSFLVGWVGLTQQMLGMAAVTWHDQRQQPLVPRWFTIATIIGAVFVPMANGCAFTMTGAFAWNGLLGFYVPIGIWGIWVDTLAYFMLKDIRRRQAELDHRSVTKSVATVHP